MIHSEFPYQNLKPSYRIRAALQITLTIEGIWTVQIAPGN